MDKAIAQQSAVSASDAITIAIISTLLSAQSSPAQMLVNTVYHTKFSIWWKSPNILSNVNEYQIQLENQTGTTLL